MTAAAPRVLFVEDSEADIELELAALYAAGVAVVHEAVDGPDELRAALGRGAWDLIIADYHMPGFNGLDALRMIREVDRDVPFVLVSGTVGEQLAVDAMRAGASDYVLKDNLTRLPAAVQRELRDGALRRQRTQLDADRAFYAESARFLADLGQLLGRSLDAEVTLRDSARYAVPALGDWVGCYVLDGGRLRVVERAAADPTQRVALPAVLDAGDPTSEATAKFLAGQPLVYPALTDADPARDDAHRDALRTLGVRALLVVPLRGRGEILGAFAFAFGPRERSYGDREVALATEFATRVGLAVENARLYAAAQEGVRVRDEFLAMLGHELRNPLAPIVTALQLLRLRGVDTTRKEFAVIERQTGHLVRLVDDLLDVARVTRGKVSLERAPLDLAVPVAKGIETAGPLVTQHRHRLTVDVPAAGLVVSGDEARLAQVVANLVTNAAKYTPPGGEIRVSAAREGDDVVLRVADNGTGISPDLLPRLFDLFVQGPRGIDRAAGGLGLGLALVRNLVGLHGGSVAAHSEGPGRGSEFTVRLPALAHDALPAATPAPTAPRAAGRARVLIVDDNVDASEMLAGALSAHGCTVQTATGAHEGLAAAEAFAPEAAVLDIGLPEMDGYELATRLRARYGASLRLVAVTGYGQQRDQKRAREAGFDAHLVKPVDVAALLAALAPSTTD